MEMEMELDLICRTCLKTDKNTKPLFQSNAADMLNYCNFWEAHQDDGFPTRICDQCDDVLVKCYEFKKLCIQSRSILESYSYKEVEGATSQDLILIDTEYKNPETGKNEHSENCSISETIQDVKECCEPEFSQRDDICNMNMLTFQNNEDVQCRKDDYNLSSTIIPKEDLTAFLETSSTSSLPYSCRECADSFLKENDLQLHQATHTKGELVCIACEKKFANRQRLKRHIKIHMNVKPHMCQICNKGFAESYALTKHMRSHNGVPRDKKHFCSECGQGYPEPFYLKIHMRKHTGERPFVCDTCAKTFSDPRSLKAHYMTHTGEKPYKCQFCSKAFSQSINLTKHVRIHTGERPYICIICGKAFSQTTSLERHYRMHTGEKPFTCNECSKRFAEKRALIQHMRTHTGEKPYVCEVCGKAFASSSELKLHDRKHTGIKKHVCDNCERDFATPSALVIHKRSHTGEKPFSCNVCQKRFAEKRSLIKHTKLHRDDQIIN